MSVTLICLLSIHGEKEEHGESRWWRENGPLYLEKMVRNARKHIPGLKEIRCITDCPEKMPEEVTSIYKEAGSPGWWAKLQMFAPETSSGKCLYLDLDNVIGGDLSELVALEPDPLYMVDDRVYPRMPNGSTLLFNADHPTCRELWAAYKNHKELWQAQYRQWPDKASDQAYIADSLRAHGHPIRFLQDDLPQGYILNSRAELPYYLTPESYAPCRLTVGSWRWKPGLERHPFYDQHWVNA